MALFGLVFLVVMLVLFGVGLAVGLAVLTLAAVLLGLGVISSSVIVGLRSGRAAAGIRAFLLQCGVLAGAPAGAACAWLVQSLFELEGYGSGWPVLLYGALGGAFAGVLIALSLDFISRRLYSWASSRLPADVRALRIVFLIIVGLLPVAWKL
jgi:hypothetical protein